MSDLDGTWSLVSWVNHYDDGRVDAPFGDAPKGIITYGEGRMACVMSTRDRPRFSRGGQFTSDDDDKIRAYDTCIAYAGTVEVGDGWVDHHVDISLYPNWDGTIQHRVARIDGASLHLSARLEENSPEARTALLEWRRMKSGATEH